MKVVSLIKVGFISVISAILFAALLLTLGNSGTIEWFPPFVVFSLVAVTLLSGVIFPFIIKSYIKRSDTNAANVYAILHAFSRYCIAFNIASFGWKKVLGLQFVVPSQIAAIPMNQQTGEWLTWYYFGYSYPFGIIIAVLQITGSYLLLFRKTFLIGLFILLPLMINIAMVDIFYHMNTGALLQAVVLTAGLLFLSMLHYHELIKVFIASNFDLPLLPLKSRWTKNLLGLSAIILSLLFTVYIKTLVKH